MIKRRFYILLLLSLTADWLCAQTFEVRSFKLLDNDISAYIDPVRDLNDEACALIKVVGDKDFVFSTPLGVVSRKEKVGEVWIYLPKGSQKLTIKHPRWGVLRDYLFAYKLESRLTYELLLAAPVNNEPMSAAMLRVRQKPRPPMVPDVPVTATLPAPPYRRPKIPPTYFAMLNAAIHSSEFAWGGMVGAVRRHGGYIRALSNFQSLSTGGLEADKDGNLYGGGTKPYYTGTSYCSRVSLTVGAMHRLARPFYMYEGLGYGSRIQAWETTEGERVKIADYSYQGLACEAGCLWRGRRWAASLGVLTVKASYWELIGGVGFTF